ncbi:MAG: hypothetical protein EXR95_05575 [Gemmatimonadetes bacterium]|nr:hypothetical protein [Gemmatimonadota bacterium]
MGAAAPPGARLRLGKRARRSSALAAAVVAGAFGARPAAAQDTHLLLVVGLAGDSAYAARFRGWASTVHDAAVGRLGVSEANVVWLGDDPAAPAGRIKDKATVAALRSAVAQIAQRAGPEDRVLVVLIGHGTEREGKPLFNLTGPDLTPADLGLTLDQLAPRRVAVVNTASASGGFVGGLAAPGRTVITATRSGRENNETWFAGFFADALAQEGSDLDKDGRISLFEAFEYARREVNRYFEEKKILVTEHALLDGNGDGEGTMAPAADQGDGLGAGTFYVGGDDRAVAAQAAASDDPVLRGLLAERARIEERVAALRARKAEMDPAAYDRELEALVVELALKSREVREHGGGR